MKAGETILQLFIEGTRQYVVPLFQRSYSWDKHEWEILWNDLMDLCKSNNPRTHFLGSVVTMQVISVPEGVTKHLLIDGQQRITTIFILLSFLRDKAKESGDEELSAEITNTLLVNTYKKDFDYYKLLPTQVDRDAFHKLVKSGVASGEEKISSAYQFFKRKFEHSGVDVNSLKKIISSNLSIISILLDVGDDPHLVFESLNAKGRPLTQSDLIRNFFFMKIHVNEQDSIYAEYWKPMQDVLDERLTEYIRHYLIKDGLWIKENDVYFSLKEKVGDRDALSYLKEVSHFAEFYKKLLYPEKYESDLAIQGSLSRINRLGTTTTIYPFLLNCYDAYTNKKISHKEFLQTLNILENFIIRRFICNVPTNQLNRIFPPLYSQIQSQGQESFVEGLKKILQTKEYPKDIPFKAKFINASFYTNKDRIAKATLILETIEKSYKHKEKIDFKNLTIEHVMPQTLTDEWKNELGESWGETHDLYLHVIGNLTLTAYNPELSNFSFERKKKLLAESHLEINKYFGNSNTWNRNDIDWRSAQLADLALSIWPYFGDDQPEQSEQLDVTWKTPLAIRVFGKIIQVESWSDVIVSTLNEIIELEPDKFQRIVNRFPRRFNKEKLHRGRELSNKLFVEVNMSAKDAYRFCQQFIEEAEFTSDNWQVRVS